MPELGKRTYKAFFHPRKRPSAHIQRFFAKKEQNNVTGTFKKLGFVGKLSSLWNRDSKQLSRCVTGGSLRNMK